MSSKSIKHALIMPNAIVGADAPKIVDYAIAAEEAGWDGFFPFDILVNPCPGADQGQAGDPESGWNPDEYKDFVDPWISLAGIATRTERITLGTWITPVARRQPWQVARDIATLDRLSNGRVMFGTGLGRRPDYEKFGMPFEAKKIGEMYDEALEIITRFWSGDRVTFHGEHFTIDDVAVLPTPQQQPRPPILIAGYWPNKKPFRRGAQWDGIMPMFGAGADKGRTPEESVREMLGWYRDFTDEPGDIFMPYSPGGESDKYVDLCLELGTTWFYTYPSREWLSDVEGHIRTGPPAS
jgi:alkanesulfonate monooxygenase SsuD/methylene tetrahydromethanopterin reductase-like flavin-dependent oxidoreductase (luciferase family)